MPLGLFLTQAFGLRQPVGGRLPRGADRPAQAHPVGRIKQHQAAGWQSIPAGAAGLLQVALRTGRQIQMKHQTHIGAIHPHAEGHGGHQHRRGVILEMLQRQLAAFGIQTGVIGDRLDAGPPKPGCPLLHRAAGAGIDENGAPGPAHRLQHLGQGIGGPPGHAVAEVGTAGRTHLHQRTAELEQADDVGPDLGTGRGAQGHQGHPGAEGTELAQAPVVGAEIMAPGTDAVGLIHRQCHQLPRRDALLEQLADGLRLEPFRGEVEQTQAPIPEALQQLAAILRGKPPVQTGGGDATALQLAHLILHQGHQR